MREISWLAENWLASQEGLCFMEWVSKGSEYDISGSLFWNVKACILKDSDIY